MHSPTSIVEDPKSNHPINILHVRRIPKKFAAKSIKEMNTNLLSCYYIKIKYIINYV